MRKTQLLFIPVLMTLSLPLLVLPGELNVNNKNFPTTPTFSITNSKIREQNQTQLPLYYLSSEVSPNGFYRIDSFSGDYADRYNYYQLFVTDLRTYEENKIYSSDFRTSDWKWTADNKIEITYDCGTGCRATKIASVDETIVHSESNEGLISKEGGWNVEYFKSF